MKIKVEPGIIGAPSNFGMGETPQGEQVFAFVDSGHKVLLVFTDPDELKTLCCMMGAAALVLSQRVQALRAREERNLAAVRPLATIENIARPERDPGRSGGT